MWILRSGTVGVRAAGDPPLLLARLGPGSPLGEVGLLEQSSRSADVVAEEDGEAFLLTAEAFSAILVQDPELGQTILFVVARHLAARLREANEDLRMTSIGA